jgi:hypothetical protein
MRHTRSGVLLVALALIVAACGGGDAPVAASDTSVVGTEAAAPIDQTTVPGEPAGTDGSSESSASPAAERPAPDPSREIAPDFTLALGDGSTFVLSEEIRPVFMVFWAEW